MNFKGFSSSDFLFSLGLHGGLLLALVIKVYIFPSDPILYSKAIKVDMVALPDKFVTLPESKPIPKPVTPTEPSQKVKPEPQSPPKEDPKPEPEPEPESEPQPPKKTSPEVEPKPPIKSKDKQEAKPRKEPNKVTKKEKKDEVAKKTQTDPPPPETTDEADALDRLKKMANKSSLIKGNQLSEGNSLTGLAKLHHRSYLDELDAHIKKTWSLPQWLSGESFKARVIITITATGKIKTITFSSPSGNESFDNHVRGALKKAEPLPSPPDSLLQFMEQRGVELRFPD